MDEPDLAGLVMNGRSQVDIPLLNLSIYEDKTIVTMIRRWYYNKRTRKDQVDINTPIRTFPLSNEQHNELVHLVCAKQNYEMAFERYSKQQETFFASPTGKMLLEEMVSSPHLPLDAPQTLYVTPISPTTEIWFHGSKRLEDREPYFAQVTKAVKKTLDTSDKLPS